MSPQQPNGDKEKEGEENAGGDDIEKSKRRLKNRFKGIKNPEDAIDEFGS